MVSDLSDLDRPNSSLKYSDEHSSCECEDHSMHVCHVLVQLRFAKQWLYPLAPWWVREAVRVEFYDTFTPLYH